MARGEFSRSSNRSYNLRSAAPARQDLSCCDHSNGHVDHVQGGAEHGISTCDWYPYGINDKAKTDQISPETSTSLTYESPAPSTPIAVTKGDAMADQLPTPSPTPLKRTFFEALQEQHPEVGLSQDPAKRCLAPRAGFLQSKRSTTTTSPARSNPAISILSRHRPSHSVKLSASELRRVTGCILLQINWEKVCLVTATNRAPGAYQQAIEELFQTGICEAERREQYQGDDN